MADYATLLRDHTTLTCRSVDRIFLQSYVPRLQSPGLVARFLLKRGYPFPSSAALGEIGEKYVAEISPPSAQLRLLTVDLRHGETEVAP
jgi:hypothetical protein